MTASFTDLSTRSVHLNDSEIKTYSKLEGAQKTLADAHLVKCAECREQLPLSGYHKLLGALFEKEIENGRIRDFG